MHTILNMLFGFWILSNQIFHYTCFITPKRIKNRRLAYLFVIGIAGDITLFKEMLQRWRAVVSDLTGQRFESQTYRSRDELERRCKSYKKRTFVIVHFSEPVLGPRVSLFLSYVKKRVKLRKTCQSESYTSFKKEHR